MSNPIDPTLPTTPALDPTLAKAQQDFVFNWMKTTEEELRKLADGPEGPKGIAKAEMDQASQE
jgi:hypothetical protein